VSPEPSKTAEKAERLVKRWLQMQSDRMPWLVQWQEIADLMAPRSAGISSKTNLPDTSREGLLFDTTAGDALMTMAGGLMSWMMPANEPWFGFDPTRELRGSDKVKKWTQECSELAREYLSNSSFYTEAHEDWLSHCGFGTSALYYALEEGLLRFEHLPTGSYCIEENRFGVVDVLFREFEWTIEEAAKHFGKESLSKKSQEALMGSDDKRKLAKIKILHAVYPRPEDERPDNEIARMADWGKAFASCYVEIAEKHSLKESGFDHFPFSVGRYLKWTALEGKTAYGYGPGFAALPDTRQINFLQMMMDCEAEKRVRPSMIADSRMEGDIVLSAGGITYIDQGMVEPKPIQVGGDYNVGQDRVKMRQESIRAKFHAQLFNMFEGLDGIRTATEINERAAEKITAITPAFSRIANEKHTPMLQGLFSLWMEAGMLPTPPQEAIMRVSEFVGIVPNPAVTFSSRLALAIKSLRNIDADRHIQRIVSLAPLRPEVLEPFDWMRWSRGSARDAGVPTDYILDEEVVEQRMAAQAEAQAAAAKMQMVEQGAKSLGAIGGVDALAKLGGQAA
jgi:hypothetical protein